jgi:hypothetical protein
MRNLCILFLIFFNLNCFKTKRANFDLSSGSPFLFGSILLFQQNQEATRRSNQQSINATGINFNSRSTFSASKLLGSSSANAGVSKVEVKINSGNFLQTTGTTNWELQVPFQTKWTYSFSNTITVRVTDTQGNVKEIPFTQINKEENRDSNGDGIVDLIVSAPTYNSSQGRVYVFNGNSTNGIASNLLISNANQTFTGLGSSRFGSKLAMADFNGDGFGDLAVCEFLSTSVSASINSYLGSAKGFGSRIVLSQSTGQELCSSMAVGDFNNDGYSDLLVSNTVGPNGVVNVYLGTATGVSTSINQSLVIISPSNFGGSVTVGDVDGDGYLDFAARTLSASNVYIHHGSATGFTLKTLITTSNTISSLLLADINGDGKADLMIGETGFNTNQGRVLIHLSNGSSIATSSSQIITGEGTSFQFARSLSMGDLNQDGIPDLIAGNDLFQGQGRVYVFYGCLNSGICKGSGIASSSSNFFITGDTGNLFGVSTTVVDVNRDNRPDLLLGATGFSSGNGGLFIYHAPANGFNSSYTASEYNIRITGEGGLGGGLY